MVRTTLKDILFKLLPHIPTLFSIVRQKNMNSIRKDNCSFEINHVRIRFLLGIVVIR